MSKALKNIAEDDFNADIDPNMEFDEIEADDDFTEVGYIEGFDCLFD